MKNHSAESIELASLDDKLVHNSEAMNTDQDVLSKSQLKRIRKEELWKLRKIQKKSLRHEKFHQEASVITGDSSGAEKQSNVEIEEISRHDTGEYVNMPTSQNSSKKNLYKQNFLELCSKSFSVIIDCSFETQHTIKTLKSLSQQIMFCYGINKRSNHPSLIHLTEIGPKLSDQLSKTLCQNWVGVTFDKCSYLESDLYTTDITKDESSVENVMKKELVYLTSDSPNIIEELSPRCAYIIGGIVDRNSFKGLTFKKASEQGIRTAKLPIKENVSLTATHVLTINHVFEILLKYVESNNWKDAIECVIPTRKVKDHKKFVTSSSPPAQTEAIIEKNEET